MVDKIKLCDCIDKAKKNCVEEEDVLNTSIKNQWPNAWEEKFNSIHEKSKDD